MEVREEGERGKWGEEREAEKERGKEGRGGEGKERNSAIQDCTTPTARVWWSQEPNLGLPDLRPIFVPPGLLLKWHQREFLLMTVPCDAKRKR